MVARANPATAETSQTASAETEGDAVRRCAPARAGLNDGDRMDPSSCFLAGPPRRFR
jgi:hypothetical protein